MNTDTPQKKEAILKSLAIVGFFVIIGLVAWLAVQAVSYAPKAFSSLASIAEGLDQYKSALGENDKDLTITSDKETVEVGKPLIVSWGKNEQPGTYAFSYDCLDGVDVEIVETEGLRAITCDTIFDLGNTNTVTIVVDSKNKTVDTLTYSIIFTHENNPELTRSGSAQVAVNSADTQKPTKDTDGTLGQNDQSDFVEDVVKTEPTATTPPTPKKPAPQKPTYTYTLPVSDPNGRVDVGTSFVNIGDIKNGAFVTGSIHKGKDGAFQFQVKNYGTKTSAPWTYTVTLPDKDTYNSPTQAPLKPTEEAFISLGFPTGTDSSHTFVVTVKVADDKNIANNSFKKTITFIK